jgi:Protein of unknown function (DUF2726)
MRRSAATIARSRKCGRPSSPTLSTALTCAFAAGPQRRHGEDVDFVICDVLTLDPVAAIEVDDRSHLLPERRDRDAFVNAVFAEIGVPLLRVKAQRSYSVAELRDLFARVGVFALPQSQGASL